MDFKQDTFMYLLGGAVVLFVIAQSLFFMGKAWKQGKELGIDKAKMKNTITSSVLFTLAPAIAILATVLILAKSLGLVLPWIRLTVIGNLQYEFTAAQAALESFGKSVAIEITDPTEFGAVMWVMFLGCILPLVLLPLVLKKIQSKVGKTMSKDSKWSDAMSSAALIGLISVFIGSALASKSKYEMINGEKVALQNGAGVASLVTLVSAMVLTVVLQWLCKKFNLKKLEAFVLPISMFGAMGMAVAVNALFPTVAQIEWRP